MGFKWFQKTKIKVKPVVFYIIMLKTNKQTHKYSSLSLSLSLSLPLLRSSDSDERRDEEEDEGWWGTCVCLQDFSSFQPI